MIADGLLGGLQVEEQPRTAFGAAVGGALGAAIGIVGGALVGVAMECGAGCSGDFGGYAGAVLGATIGEALFLPIGGHIGNGGRGSLGRNLLASLGVGAATVLLGSLTESDGILVGGMVAQLAITVATERSAGRAAPPRSLSLAVTPLGSRTVGAGVSFRF